MRRRARMFGAALLFALGAIAVIGRLGRSWTARVAVQGHSMEPTLVDGDWLLVDPDAYLHQAPRQGELVVARDPRDPARVLVKRVVRSDADGRITVTGDHAAHAADGLSIGAVGRDALLGRPWFRYWPLGGIGRIS